MKPFVLRYRNNMHAIQYVCRRPSTLVFGHNEIFAVMRGNQVKAVVFGPKEAAAPHLISTGLDVKPLTLEAAKTFVVDGLGAVTVCDASGKAETVANCRLRSDMSAHDAVRNLLSMAVTDNYAAAPEKEITLADMTAAGCERGVIRNAPRVLVFIQP